MEDREFGMQHIATYYEKIDNLKINGAYQRGIERSRYKQVLASMQKYGLFLTEHPIIITQDNIIVDGQHRFKAALEFGLKEVPVVKYKFKTPEHEAKYFVHINGFSSKQKPVDFWHSAKLTNNRIANLLYMLAENDRSVLKGMIATKGQETNHKIAVPQIIELILKAISYPEQSFYHSKIDDIAKRSELFSDNEILENINTYMSWFIESFGTKKDNKLAYNVDTFRAIRIVYIMLKEKNLANITATKEKFKTFRFGAEFIAAPSYGKKYQLINFYNKGKHSKNQLSYELPQN